MSNDQISKPIGPSISAEIAGDLNAIEGPLFAINWFDTRIAPIYHLYNTLAASRVNKINGKVLFKGKVGEMISGNPAWARKYLLIVNYPSGHQFLKLISDKIFQVMSVLRIAAVKDFSFVFQQRTGEPQLLEKLTTKFDSSLHHTVVHFSLPDAETAQDRFAELGEIAKQHQCEIFYIGTVAGKVTIISEKKGREPMAFITDCTALIQSNTAEPLAKLWQSESMRSFIDRTEDHFAAHVVRVL